MTSDHFIILLGLAAIITGILTRRGAKEADDSGASLVSNLKFFLSGIVMAIAGSVGFWERNFGDHSVLDFFLQILNIQ